MCVLLTQSRTLVEGDAHREATSIQPVPIEHRAQTEVLLRLRPPSHCLSPSGSIQVSRVLSAWHIPQMHGTTLYISRHAACGRGTLEQHHPYRTSTLRQTRTDGNQKKTPKQKLKAKMKYHRLEESDRHLFPSYTNTSNTTNSIANNNAKRSVVAEVSDQHRRS